MLKPLRNKVIAEQLSIYTKSLGGVYLASSAKETLRKATVVSSAVQGIKEGDVIYPRKYTWQTFRYNEKDLISISLDHILAIERNGEFYAVRDMVLAKIEYKEKIGSFYVPGTRKQYRADFLGRCVSVGPEYKYDLKKGDLVYITRIEDAGHEGHKIDTPQGVLWAIKSKWVVAIKPND